MHLESQRKELADLQISIPRQRFLLIKLEEREAAVRAELDAFIFPVLTLPLEITTEIFLHYASGAHNYNFRFPDKDVLLLLMVCRAWRTLALSVPALWATLDAGAHPDRNPPGEMQQMIDTWFSRAGALPLSFTWFGGAVEPQINAIIRRHSPRLQFLNLGIFTGCISHLIDNIPFPLLRSLDLGNYAGTTPTLPVLTFREAAQLRHVTLENIPPPSLILPWELVENFRAISITPQECLDVLRAAPSLRKFEFYGSYNNSFIDQSIILHARLTSFRFCSGNQEIMRYLALPALEDLYFGNLLELEDDIFLPFLTRSRGSLRNFTFSCWSPGLVLPMQWFRHMAHLTSLTLPHLQPQSRVNFVRALTREHEREFLPTLKDLTLTDWNPDDVDMQLLDALETRCTRTETEDGQARMQLKSFRLIWTAELPGTSIPSLGIASLVHRHGVALRDLQGSGMRIHIGTENKDLLGCSTAVVAGVNVATGHLSY
ncbi:hypothetical protein C8R44DRAFT_729373 [Mycena epipterygia]|nr:hypothetical protein C8R44DRAFT_729373 [Mycena epipterygia]